MCVDRTEYVLNYQDQRLRFIRSDGEHIASTGDHAVNKMYGPTIHHRICGYMKKNWA